MCKGLVFIKESRSNRDGHLPLVRCEKDSNSGHRRQFRDPVTSSKSDKEESFHQEKMSGRTMELELGLF